MPINKFAIIDIQSLYSIRNVIDIQSLYSRSWKIWTWCSIINLQHIANLPNTFTKNKDVTTSYYSCNPYARRVEVPNSTTLLPKWEQKGEKSCHMGFKFSYVSADIEEMLSSNCKCNSTSSWITQNGCSPSKPTQMCTQF
jgi:hypothetical protein